MRFVHPGTSVMVSLSRLAPLRPMLTLIPVPAFRDNYIWLIHDAAGHCLVVDPGDGAAALQALNQHRLSPQAILITHHHSDHVGGIATLLQHWSVPVYGPAAEAIPHCSHPVRDGDVLDLPRPAVRLQVMAVPGHTLGHVAYYGDIAPAPVLFCGDTLFSAGCGRLFEGTPAQMLASLERLARLPGPTRVCCAHEYTSSNLAFALAMLPEDPAVLARHRQVTGLREVGQPSLPSTIDEEKRSNLFLRCHEPALARALNISTMEPVQRLPVFTALRARKDHF